MNTNKSARAVAACVTPIDGDTNRTC